MTLHPSVLQFLLQRRSAVELELPVPSSEQLRHIIEVAATAPDHGTLRPYRFAIIQGEGRERFGEALVDAMASKRPDMPAAIFQKVRGKAFKAPMAVLVIASPVAGKIDRWEQVATAACAGFGLVLGAQALGYGAVWKSSPQMMGPKMAELFQLTEDEEVLGWVNLGTEVGAPAGERALSIGRAKSASSTELQL